MPRDVNLEDSGGSFRDERRHIATGRKVSCGHTGRGTNGYTTHRRSVAWGDVTRRLNGRGRIARLALDYHGWWCERRRGEFVECELLTGNVP
jgi:hypothetical protein